MLAAAARGSEQRRRSDVAWWSAGGLVGILTLPTLVFPFVLHGLVMLASPGRRFRLSVVAGIGGVGVASLAFYWRLLPAIMDESTAVGGRHGSTPGPIDAFVQPFDLLVGPSAQRGLPLLPDWLALVAGAVLMGAGVFTLARVRRDRPLLLHLVLPVVGTMLAMGVVGMHVRERYISFLLFHCLVLAALGLVWAVRSARSFPQARVAATAVMVALAVLAAAETVSFATRLSTLPRENFKEVVTVLGDDRPERVITNRRYPVGFQFYLGMRRSELEMVEPQAAPGYVCEADPPFVFLDYPHNAESGDLSCLERRGAVLVRLPQRAEPYSLNVWILQEAG
jgi:hypothetical protein